MNFRREISLLVTLAALALAAAPAWAQYGGYGPQGMDPRMAAYGPPGGMMPPGMVAPTNYYGDPSLMGPMGGPMGPMPMGPMGPGGAADGPMGQDGASGYCDQCGGAGCGACGGGHGCLDWLCDMFGEGYRCRPRWYDVQVDFVSFKRDQTSRTVVYAQDASLLPGDPTVLTTDDLTMGTGNGARVTGAWLFGPGTAFEASWMGGFFFQDRAVVTSPTDELAGPAGGTDDSVVAINYQSHLDTVELSVRRRFQEPDCRYQGSFLVGFRYIRLHEQFDTFERTAADDEGELSTETGNDLYGCQVGYEFNIRPLPRLLLDAQWKIGVYGNSADGNLAAFLNGVQTGQFQDPNTEIALASELNFNLVYNVNERMAFRAGYNLFYVDGVALASENVYNLQALDPINVNGSLFVHGYNIGFEHNW